LGHAATHVYLSEHLLLLLGLAHHLLLLLGHAELGLLLHEVVRGATRAHLVHVHSHLRLLLLHSWEHHVWLLLLLLGWLLEQRLLLLLLLHHGVERSILAHRLALALALHHTAHVRDLLLGGLSREALIPSEACRCAGSTAHVHLGSLERGTPESVERVVLASVQ